MMKCACGGELKSANNFSGNDLIEEKKKYIKNIPLDGIPNDSLIIRSRKCTKCGVYSMTVEILDKQVEVRPKMRATLKKKNSGK